MAAQLAAVRRRADELEALRDEVAAVRGSARSALGEVDVLVDARGRLVRLRLGDRACTLRPAVLAKLVEDTVRSAAASAQSTAVALAEQRFGRGSQVAALVRADLAPASARASSLAP